jgi:hypothetical protein
LHINILPDLRRFFYGRKYFLIRCVYGRRLGKNSFKEVVLTGSLLIPENATGLVVFAHRSGSCSGLCCGPEGYRCDDRPALAGEPLVKVVPSAAHLFEEQGALEDVANFAEK